MTQASYSNPTGESGAAATAEVRRTSRVRCHMLQCEHGAVVDLSSAGMRVHRRGSVRVRVGERLSVHLSMASRTVAVGAEVIWVRKTGFRRHEVGLQFVDVGSDEREALDAIAKCASKLDRFIATDAA